MKVLNSYIAYKAFYSYMATVVAKILKNHIHFPIAQCKLPLCCFTSTPILAITMLR